jgi:hypothetical protein
MNAMKCLSNWGNDQMAIKKKTAIKKKRTSAKKVSKKKTPTKKSAIKKKVASKLKANAGKIRIEVTKGGNVDGGPKSVWSVVLKGLNGDSIPAGLVTAATKREALEKGKRLLKRV